MSKSVIVQIVQPDPGGPRYGQVFDPADFLKGQAYSHQHVERVVRDLLVKGAGGAQVVGFDYELPGGLTVRLNNCGHIISTFGLSYEYEGDSTVDLPLVAANALLPRIDLVCATLETDALTEEEFRAFVRLRDEAEYEANLPPYPPVQFAQPTEKHNRLSLSVRTGVAPASPVAPSTGANEVALYQILVPANTAELEAANVTDTRQVARSLFVAHQKIDITNQRIDTLEFQFDQRMDSFETSLILNNTNLPGNVRDIVAAFLAAGAGLAITRNGNLLTVSLALTPQIIKTALGYTPVNKAGDTMQRQLHLEYFGQPGVPLLRVDGLAKFQQVVIDGTILSPGFNPILKYVPNASLDNSPIYQVGGTDNGSGERAGIQQRFYGNLNGTSGFSHLDWFTIFSGPRGLHTFINGISFDIPNLATGVAHADNGKGFVFRSRDLAALGGLNAILAVETETHAPRFYVKYNGDTVVTGNLDVGGSIIKASGTFLVDHPLDPDNKNLFHGYVEAPRYELVYRGRVQVVNGRAEVDIDADYSMTAGTFAALTQNADPMVNNITGWTRVRVENLEAVKGGRFVIIAEDLTCNDTVMWLVIAERADPFIRTSGTTDEDGHLVPETFKPAPTAEDMAQLKETVRIESAATATEDVETEEIVASLRGKRGYPLQPEAIGRSQPMRKVIIRTLAEERAQDAPNNNQTSEG